MPLNIELLKEHCQNYIKLKSCLGQDAAYGRSIALDWISELTVRQPQALLDFINDYEQIKSERDVMKKRLTQNIHHF